MKKYIALPAENGGICMHFGHCPYFAVYEVEKEIILSESKLDAPPHEPGLLPKWLRDKGITDIIAGGMGQRAIDLFEEQNINVLVGVNPGQKIDKVIAAYLAGNIKGGGNLCDH